MTGGSPVSAGGFSALVAGLSSGVASTLPFSFGMIVLLFLLRVLVRVEWLAGLVWVVVFATGVGFGQEIPWIGILAGLPYYAVTLATARVGLVPLILANLIDGFFLYPMTLDRSAWYAGQGYGYLVVLAALIACGFRTSLGGRRMLEMQRLDG